MLQVIVMSSTVMNLPLSLSTEDLELNGGLAYYSTIQNNLENRPEFEWNSVQHNTKVAKYQVLDDVVLKTHGVNTNDLSNPSLSRPNCCSRIPADTATGL